MVTKNNSLLNSLIFLLGSKLGEMSKDILKPEKHFLIKDWLRRLNKGFSVRLSNQSDYKWIIWLQVNVASDSLTGHAVV